MVVGVETGVESERHLSARYEPCGGITRPRRVGRGGRAKPVFALAHVPTRHGSVVPAERAVPRLPPHGADDLGARETDILELAIAHHVELGDRGMLDAPGEVGPPLAPEDGAGSGDGCLPGGALRRDRRAECGAHVHLHWPFSCDALSAIHRQVLVFSRGSRHMRAMTVHSTVAGRRGGGRDTGRGIFRGN